MSNLKKHIGFWIYNTGNLFEENYFDTSKTKNILFNWISGTGKGTFKRGLALTLSSRVNYDVNSYNDFISELLLETSLDESKEEFNGNKTKKIKALNIFQDQFNLNEPNIKYKSFFSTIFENDINEIFLILTFPTPNQTLQLEKHFIKFDSITQFNDFKNSTEFELKKQNTSIKDIIYEYESTLKNSYFEIFKDKDKKFPLTNSKSIFYSGFKSNIYEKIIVLSIGLNPKETLKKVSSNIITESSITTEEEIKEIHQSLQNIDIDINEIIKLNENDLKKLEEIIELIESNSDLKTITQTSMEIKNFIGKIKYYENRLENEKKSLLFDIKEIEKNKIKLDEDIKNIEFKQKTLIVEHGSLKGKKTIFEQKISQLNGVLEKNDYDLTIDFFNISTNISNKINELKENIKLKKSYINNKTLELNKLKKDINFKNKKMDSELETIDRFNKNIKNLKEQKLTLENNVKTIFNTIDNSVSFKRKFYIYNVIDILNINTSISDSINDNDIDTLYNILKNNLSENIDIDDEINKLWVNHIKNEEENTIEYINKQIINSIDELNDHNDLLSKLNIEIQKLNSEFKLLNNSDKDEIEKELNLMNIELENLTLHFKIFNNLIEYQNKINFDQIINDNLLKNNEKNQEIILLKEDLILKNTKLKEYDKQLSELYNSRDQKFKEFKFSRNNELLKYVSLSDYNHIILDDFDLIDIYDDLIKEENEILNKIYLYINLFDKILIQLEISKSQEEKYLNDRILINDNKIYEILKRIEEIYNLISTQLENEEIKNKNIISSFATLLSKISNMNDIVFGNVNRNVNKINKKLKQKKSISNIHYLIFVQNIEQSSNEFNEISSLISNLFNKDINFFDGDNLNKLDYSILINSNNEKLRIIENLKEQLKNIQYIFESIDKISLFLNKKIKEKLVLIPTGIDGNEQEVSGGNSMAINDFARKEFLNFIKIDNENFTIPLFFDEISKSDVSDILKTIDQDNSINFYLQQGTDSVNQDIIDISTVYESEVIPNPIGYSKNRKIFMVMKTGEPKI